MATSNSAIIKRLWDLTQGADPVHMVRSTVVAIIIIISYVTIYNWLTMYHFSFCIMCANNNSVGRSVGVFHTTTHNNCIRGSLYKYTSSFVMSELCLRLHIHAKRIR